MADVVRMFRLRHAGVELHFWDAEPYEVLEVEALRCDCSVMFDLNGWPSALSYDGKLVA